MRNFFVQESCFKVERLCISAIQNCPIRIGAARPHRLFDELHTQLCLRILRWQVIKAGLLSAGSARCNQRFTEPSLIAGHNRVGDAQNRFIRAVVPHQPDNLCVRKLTVKGQDVLHLRAAEPVNGLIVITDNANIRIFAGQFPQQLKLSAV